MKTSDITLSFIIFIIFIGLYVFNVLSVGIKKVTEDWPNYRCNPTVMPFASIFGHDPVSNFTYCIQNMQTNYMGYLMQPLQYNFNVLGDLGSQMTTAINDVRAFFNNIRNFITDIIQKIFGVFLNILIEFQRLTINIKDLFGKLIGIMGTLMYTLSGSIMTMKSVWAGPPGQLARALCFHPDTKVELKNGSIVKIQDIPLNAILKNGARVCAVMNISNLDEQGEQVEKLYAIPTAALAVGAERHGAEPPILVSGSHLVYCPELKRFIHVEELNKAVVTDIKCDNLACLITSDHTIAIGGWIFHDWEDNNGSKAKDFCKP
uniref:Hedgehog/Intein (Hint) domain-containing protein n=1 Tax=viral metagenome TaxID=1070528 RepID=A0A6C0HGA5_9ZZZZ